MVNKDQVHPVNVIQTHDWFAECKRNQSKLAIQHPLIITSRGNLARLKLAAKFDQRSIFSNVDINPSLHSCAYAIEFCQSNDFDGVIAIGGGSVMDTSKSVMASMSTGIYDIEKLIRLNGQYKTHIPAIFIPTTHGTGSEVTMWGTIWGFQQEKKYSISNSALFPDVAILDGKLTLTLPLDISLTTVLDALSHSLESIWNRNSNPQSTEYATIAIGKIFENIDKLKSNPSDLTVRKELLLASNLAGLAFSRTKTAAAHSISYPLTIDFNIPHGIACSITLPSLLRTNESAILTELKAIFSDLKISGIEELIRLIYEIPKGFLKFKLSEWGINHKHLDLLTNRSFTKERMENNIVELNEEKVFSILEECL